MSPCYFFGDHHRPFKTFQKQKPCQFCRILIFCVHASSVWFRIALGDHCHEDKVSKKSLAVKIIWLVLKEEESFPKQTLDFSALHLMESVCLLTWITLVTTAESLRV